MTTQYLLITAGCAECRFDRRDPLIEIHGPFDTIEAAMKASGLDVMNPDDWIDHPQGGIFNGDGQGDDWIMPVPAGVFDKFKE